MNLRNFSQEGYDEGGSEWKRVRELVRRTIAENLNDYKKQKGKTLPKWTKNISIGGGNKEKIAAVGNLMAQIAEENSHGRIIRDVARAITRGYQVKQKDFANEFWAIQHWIQNNIRYVFDTNEQFQTPQRIMVDWYQGHEGADCDCMTMLYLSFMRALGQKDVAIGLLDAAGNGTLSHAIALVKLPKGEEPWGKKWIGIELTKKKQFGWITPKMTKLVVTVVGK